MAQTQSSQESNVSVVKVVCESFDKELTAMNHPNARPRWTGLLYISARNPATIAMGALATAPARNRKIRSEGQLGASAHAIVQTKNNA